MAASGICFSKVNGPPGTVCIRVNTITETTAIEIDRLTIRPSRYRAIAAHPCVGLSGHPVEA